MQIGILGFPKVGKTTLFNILTAANQSTDKFAASQQVNVGVARVPDERLDRLRDLFEPRKYTPATVDLVDIPGLRSGAGRESLDLEKMRSVDALVHVVRAFADPELSHPAGGVDPARDVVSLDLELILSDHDLVSRRLERLAQAAKRGLRMEEQSEHELLAGKVLPWLEGERALRELDLTPVEWRRLRGFQLLSAKPLLLAINVDEGALGEADPAALGIDAGPHRDVIVVSAPIEEEISRLDSEEQRDFLADLGLEQPSLERLVRASFHLLGLIAFFTVGEDEVRAWTIRRGSTAAAAARAIHSDLERGFIRAEVTGWEEMLASGSMASCRAAGTLRLEGREYPVADGEIVHVRFNV